MLKRLAVITAMASALGTAAWAEWDFQVDPIEIVSPVSVPLPGHGQDENVSGLIKSMDIPDVSAKAPFSEAAGYMSLAGHLRQLAYEKSGTWLTPQQAMTGVRIQAEAADR